MNLAQMVYLLPGTSRPPRRHIVYAPVEPHMGLNDAVECGGTQGEARQAASLGYQCLGSTGALL